MPLRHFADTCHLDLFSKYPQAVPVWDVADRVMVGAGALGLHRCSQMWVFGCPSIASSLFCSSSSMAPCSGSWTSALILGLLSWAPINVWCLVHFCLNYLQYGENTNIFLFSRINTLQDCESLDEDQKIKVPLFLLKWVEFFWEGRETLCFL